MATKEFLQERVTKAQDAIAKKQATLARHQMAYEKAIMAAKTETPWSSYEEAEEHYGDSEKAREYAWIWEDADDKREDIERTEKSIHEAESRLAKYQAALDEAIAKENSRDCEAILKFIAGWKALAHDFYMERLAEYYAEKQAVKDLYGTEEYEAALEIYKQNCRGVFERREVCSLWNRNRTHTEMVKVKDGKYECIGSWRSEKTIAEAEAKLNKDLEEEGKRKYDDIIERVTKVTGQITDASGLKVDQKGNLNGYITGTKQTAKVNTIGAGGYNIQCFHFRTLVHAC